MDPKLNQAPPPVNQTPASIDAPQVDSVPAPTPEVKSSRSLKKFALIGALVGLMFVGILGVGGYYFMNLTKMNTDVSTVPSPSPVEATPIPTESIQPVSGTDELNSIDKDLNQTDTTLTTELNSLEKDSSF